MADYLLLLLMENIPFRIHLHLNALAFFKDEIYSITQPDNKLSVLANRTSKLQFLNSSTLECIKSIKQVVDFDYSPVRLQLKD